MIFDDNYIELDEIVGQIDEAKVKGKKSKLSEDELEQAQEFIDDIDMSME